MTPVLMGVVKLCAAHTLKPAILHHACTDFEDYSCEMIFGLTPPSLEEDEVMQQGCIAQCPTALGERPVCHKLC